MSRTSEVCPYPWTEINIYSNGVITPCSKFNGSLFTKNKNELNISSQDILNSFQSSDFNLLRDDQLKDNRLIHCENCKRYDKHSQKSYKQNNLNENEITKRYRFTGEDGRILEEPKILNFHLVENNAAFDFTKSYSYSNKNKEIFDLILNENRNFVLNENVYNYSSQFRSNIQDWDSTKIHLIPKDLEKIRVYCDPNYPLDSLNSFIKTIKDNINYTNTAIEIISINDYQTNEKNLSKTVNIMGCSETTQYITGSSYSFNQFANKQINKLIVNINKYSLLSLNTLLKELDKINLSCSNFYIDVQTNYLRDSIITLPKVILEEVSFNISKNTFNSSSVKLLQDKIIKLLKSFNTQEDIYYNKQFFNYNNVLLNSLSLTMPKSLEQLKSKLSLKDDQFNANINHSFLADQILMLFHEQKHIQIKSLLEHLNIKSISAQDCYLIGMNSYTTFRDHSFLPYLSEYIKRKDAELEKQKKVAWLYKKEGLYDLAYSLHHELLDVSPNDIEVLESLCSGGWEFLNQENLEHIFKFYEVRIEHFDDMASNKSYCLLLKTTKQHEKAIHKHFSFIEKYGEDEDIIFSLISGGWKDLSNTIQSKLIQFYEDYISLHDSYLAKKSLSFIHKDLGHSDKAIIEQLKLIEIDPDDNEILESIITGGWLNCSTENKNHLLTFYQRQSKKEDSSSIIVPFAILLKDLNRIDESFVLFKKCYFNNPSEQIVLDSLISGGWDKCSTDNKYQLIDIYLDQINKFNNQAAKKPLALIYKNVGEITKSFDLHKELINIDSNDAEILDSLTSGGWTSLDQGKISDLIIIYEDLKDLNLTEQQHLGLKLNLAWCYKFQGELEKAIKLLFQVLERNDHPTARKYLQTGDWFKIKEELLEKLINYHFEWIEKDNSDFNALYSIGFIYFNTHNPKMAIEYLSQAFKLKKDELLASTLADLSFKTENFGKSLFYYEELNSISPKNVNTLKMLGWLEKKFKRYSKASKYFEQAISIDPTDTDAQDEVNRLNKSVVNKVINIFKEKLGYNNGR